MSTTLRRPRMSRETRLLIATIVVSAGTLFVLAWFRFPDAPPAATPGPALEQPLERLAARAAYDELNAIVARVEGLVTPGVVVLRATHDPANTSIAGAVPSPRLVTALRLGDDVAVAALAGTAVVEQFVERWVQVPILAHDPVRGVAVLRVTSASDGASLLAPGRVQGSPVTPGYAIAIEGAPRGPALRPAFIGRLDPLRRAGWPRGWFAPPSISPSGPGVVVVDLEGRVIGMTAGDPDPVLVPAVDVEQAARKLLADGPPEAGDLGIEAGDLSPLLMEATGSTRGAIVTAVRAGGPSEGQLQPGDVLERIGEEPVTSARDLADAVRATAPGTAVTVTVRRNREERRVTLEAGSAESLAGEHSLPPEPSSPSPGTLGLVLRTERGRGARVSSVTPGTAAAEAGLQPGDLITWFAGTDKPSPAQIRRLFAAAAEGHILAAIERNGRHRVVVMGKR